jgi:hypothetical protein
LQIKNVDVCSAAAELLNTTVWEVGIDRLPPVDHIKTVRKNGLYIRGRVCVLNAGAAGGDDGVAVAELAELRAGARLGHFESEPDKRVKSIRKNGVLFKGRGIYTSGMALPNVKASTASEVCLSAVVPPANSACCLPPEREMMSKPMPARSNLGTERLNQARSRIGPSEDTAT